MDFEELPLFGNSLRIYKYWSLILRHDWKRYFSFGPSVLMNVCQFANIFKTNSNLDVLIGDVYISVLVFNALMRGGSVVYQRYRYEKFLSEVNVVFKEIRKNEGSEMNWLLEQTCKSAKKLEILNLTFGTVASIGVLFYPLYAGIREHPFGVYIPGINKHDSPWYEIIYLYQLIITPAGCCMYIPFTSIVIILLMFGILMCKVLQHHLGGLKDLNGDEVWHELVWCIHYHKKIIRYVNLINSMTTYIYLVELLTFGALLCALLFLLTLVKTVTQVVILCTYITMIFSQVTAMYWFANELADESTNLAVAAYDSNWFEFDLKTQKSLLIFISRAQKPCSILVGNIYPMSMAMFQSLLNATYTYFTVLRRLYA